ncbi:hypothetical protein F4811DRAFT_556331 [Daldinia bambusicola]|nr:hypothetical protein F4811DRAFT_556331 [Daldinia bambusicola]
MAEEHPSYDNANHLNTNTRNWEAQSIRGVESERYSENDKHGINEDEAEAAEGYQVARPHQEQSASSSSGSTISSSIESTSTTSTAAAIKTPPSPTSPLIGDTSRPGVRFTDRGPPRTSAGHLPAVHRRSSSSAGTGVVEWGVLFDENGYATTRNNQFLRSLAKYIIDDLTPGSNDLVITPEKLRALYSRYKLSPEIYPFSELFNSRARDAHERLADFFTDLDCQYHLVPPNAYSRPRVPGLTPAGFVRYFTTCILAHPDEEFRRLDRIVADVQLVADAPVYADTGTGTGIGKGIGIGTGMGMGTGTGTGPGEPEKLPRQLFRSQFPVRHDPRSKKILAAALDDLMYDLRLLEPGSPRSSLALMPPPPLPLPRAPPSPTSTKDRSSAVAPIIRRYVFPERRDDGCNSSKHVETGRYDDGGGGDGARETTYRDRERSRYYIGKELSRYQIASSGSNSNNHGNHGCHSHNSQSSNNNHNTAALYSPTNTHAPRRARSPPPHARPYRASAPNIVGSGSSGNGNSNGNSSSNSSNSFRPAGYLPAPPPAPAPLPLAAYSTTNHTQHASGRRQSSSGRIEAVHASTTATTATAAPPFPSPGKCVEGNDAPSPGEKERKYTPRRYSVVEDVGSGSSGGGGCGTGTGGDDDYDGDDDKGPTWAEVLQSPTSASALTLSSHHHHHHHHQQQHHHHDHSYHGHHGHHHHHHHRAGSSSKEGGKSHHSRYHASH